MSQQQNSTFDDERGEMPSAIAQEAMDILRGDVEKEVSGAEAESAHLVPRAPAHIKPAPLPHAPKAKEYPSRRRS